MTRAVHPVLAVTGSVLGVLASAGLLDLLRGVPGPAVPLALPLREPGGADGASVLVVCLVPLALATLAAIVAPPARPYLGALGRAALVLVAAVIVQAISLELVAQAVLGLALTPAVDSAPPWIMAGATLIGSLVPRVRPLRRDAA